MITALPTYYAGHKFRSRLEARWAMFFDLLEIKWEYEPEGYKLSTGECYLPDFFLPKFNSHNIKSTGMWVEVKHIGGCLEKPKQFAMDHYLSGKPCDILLAVGLPSEAIFNELFTEDDGFDIDLRGIPCIFKEKYLRGGSNEDEYRLYVFPELSDDEIRKNMDHACGTKVAYAARTSSTHRFA